MTPDGALSVVFVSLANSKVASSRAEGVEAGFARNGATVFAFDESGLTICTLSAMHANQAGPYHSNLIGMTR